MVARLPCPALPCQARPGPARPGEDSSRSRAVTGLLNPAHYSDADLSAGLSSRPRLVRPYTIERIEKSYRESEEILAGCPGVGESSALDLGCGSGFHSFALATRFDCVLAVDTLLRAIWEARWLARRAGVSRIRFERADAETFRPGSRFDFVRCNGVSHAVTSRLALARNARAALTPGGWLFYGELCEGYGPMELHQAVKHRDGQAFRTRLRQLLNGFLGRPHYRFFRSGSARPVLEHAGFETVRVETGRWDGVPYFEQVWCRASGVGAGLEEDGDRDYAIVSADMREARERFADLLSRRPAAGFSAAQVTEIERLAADPANRLAPFLLFLLMTDLDPSGLAPVPRLPERTLTHLRVPQGRSNDWDRASELSRAFAELVGRHPVAAG